MKYGLNAEITKIKTFDTLHTCLLNFIFHFLTVQYYQNKDLINTIFG